jgi:hypothetical protein
LKVLKALARENQTDFDADYKLPKILKNYKGNEVDKLSIPSYSSVGRPVPAQGDSNRASFRVRPSEAPSAKAPQVSVEAVKPSTTVVEEPMKSVPITTPTTPQPSSYFTANPEWNRKWKQFISGHNVVHTSLTTKKNAIGMKIVRQLILTDEPSLVYVDTSNMSLKGNIPWEKTNPPKPAMVDKQTFTVEVPGRVFKLVDQEQNASLWVQRINAVLHATKK